jgi:hypothetical protein
MSIDSPKIGNPDMRASGTRRRPADHLAPASRCEAKKKIADTESEVT